MKDFLSLYVHIPFCTSRCGYCDFVTAAGRNDRIPAYIDALCREIERISRGLSPREPVHSIYFGGGSPSLLQPEQLAKILETICAGFSLTDDVEITVEANPGDCTEERLRAFYLLGVNRLSLGMQSSDAEELARMDRRHNHADTVRAVANARLAGFTNISLDLIIGYPLQSDDVWRQTLDDALALRPTHLSIYAISVEPNRPLDQKIRAGIWPEPDDDEIADRYDFAVTYLAERGFYRYEISNWSDDPSHESRHNKQYWLLDPYLGFGAGAYGYYANTRYHNEEDLDAYLERLPLAELGKLKLVPFPASVENLGQCGEEQMKDELIFGLRLLRDGVDFRKFCARHGLNAEHHFNHKLKPLTDDGKLRLGEDRRLRMNPDFAFISNGILVEFI